MEDELAILTGLWGETDGWKFDGHQVSLVSGHFRPKSVQQPHPPIIIGGTGSPRSLRLTVRYADEYNMSGASPEECRDAFGRLDEECRRVGRDPRSIRRSVMAGLMIAADEAELQKRVAAQVAMVEAQGTDAVDWLDARRSRWIAGTPDEARAMVGRFAEAGAEKVMLQDLLPRDHGMIELAAAELIGKV